MKPKILSKRLRLNKETIARLNGSDMKKIYGRDQRTNIILCPIHTVSCPTNDSGGLACCCGGDTTLEIC